MSDPTAPSNLATDLSTASVSDALDSLGLPGSLHGIGALRQGQRAVGPVFTVTYEPVDEAGGTVGDFLDDVPAGAVILIDNAGRTDCTVWGGIMSQTARARGIAGTVIHGTCRDVAVATDVGYPIWSVSRFMRTGKDRVRPAAVQTAVTVDGVLIRPGDILVADDDGAVAVPTARWDEVADIARRIDRVEDAIVEAVRGGATLAEARARHGYHSLQTPNDQTRKDPS
ncbi:RraA family protein [Streptomyces sp. NPDC054884]|uniref:RraA family protein n=1 Tax=Streptomyces sp. ME08-AFT2 TaxID=3028683 RepID=UPI0029B750B3|nr:RraA family protein [Streptomyces sp. ME08-AFT2]MDX3313904.1 RraA family protein [Streptomyces sp. ME08-AFT2]